MKDFDNLTKFTKNVGDLGKKFARGFEKLPKVQ